MGENMKSKIVLFIILLSLFTSCTKTVIIPDVSGVDVESVKTLLIKNDILPKIEYQYDDNIIEGIVIKTDPTANTKIELNKSIIVYVSKGPQSIISKDSLASLYNIYGVHNFEQGEWDFSSPTIYDDTLEIGFTINFETDKDFQWFDLYNSGNGIGTALINSENFREIPIEIYYNWKDIIERTPESFAIQIPLSDLENKKPTDITTYLEVEVNGKRHSVQIDFTISW